MIKIGVGYPDNVMSESRQTSIEADLEALERLQEDASELERMKSLLDRFNVFEAIGFDKDEVMHSNFLAVLLDPKQNGGLGDLFIKKVLRETLGTINETLESSVFEGLDGKDFSGTLVQREHQYIDILLINETHKLAVIIENKVWSIEHSGQLDIYHKIVTHIHPDWHVLGIYLTPNGDTPSHEAYVPFSYEAVCDIVDSILEDGGSTLDPDVKMSMKHYVRMVRRRILGDPEIVRMCQQIYHEHKRAFDLIYKHRPDFQAHLRPVVEGLITENLELESEVSSKDTIRFGVKEWDTPALLTSTGWTESKRILMFIVYNTPSSLNLHLYMGPGPAETRQKILDVIRANPDVFIMPRSLGGKWLPIFSRPILKQEAYEGLDREVREQEVRMQWDEFLDKDLPRIDAALKRENWIWESIEIDDLA